MICHAARVAVGGEGCFQGGHHRGLGARVRVRHAGAAVAALALHRDPRIRNGSSSCRLW